jgi:hypothetical protein
MLLVHFTDKCYQVIHENRLITDGQFYQVSSDMVCDTANNLFRSKITETS